MPMGMRTKSFLLEVGRRLMIIRLEQGITRSEMAKKLGVNKSNYYRNEIGIAFPRLESLIRLHVDFDISMDWLFFDISPMHIKERQAELAREKQTKALVDETPDVKQLLVAIEQDPVLRHELLTHFFKYKHDRQTRETTPPPLAEGISA
jgi:transcriptional regulator with XRE-family HTH domain